MIKIKSSTYRILLKILEMAIPKSFSDRNDLNVHVNYLHYNVQGLFMHAMNILGQEFSYLHGYNNYPSQAFISFLLSRLVTLVIPSSMLCCIGVSMGRLQFGFYQFLQN